LKVFDVQCSIFEAHAKDSKKESIMLSFFVQICYNYGIIIYILGYNLGVDID